jgi:hypothetical protein
MNESRTGIWYVTCLGDALEALHALFLSRATAPAVVTPAPAERKSKAGRNPFDGLMMFKIMVLQTLYNLISEHLNLIRRGRVSLIFRGAPR